VHQVVAIAWRKRKEPGKSNLKGPVVSFVFPYKDKISNTVQIYAEFKGSCKRATAFKVTAL
jgi:hypothetical protein